MHRFRVYDLTDVRESTPLGEITVADDGRLSSSSEAVATQAERVQRAVQALAAAQSLRVTRKISTGTGPKDKALLQFANVRPGEHGWAWAVVDALRAEHGLHATLVE